MDRSIVSILVPAGFHPLLGRLLCRCMQLLLGQKSRSFDILRIWKGPYPMLPLFFIVNDHSLFLDLEDMFARHASEIRVGGMVALMFRVMTMLVVVVGRERLTTNRSRSLCLLPFDWETIRSVRSVVSNWQCFGTGIANRNITIAWPNPTMCLLSLLQSQYNAFSNFC
jgi:hypothetical protein